MPFGGPIAVANGAVYVGQENYGPPGQAPTNLVAIDATVIATAVPSIVANLGGFAEFPWLFSVYLLAQAVTVPVYGKLADVFGRKPVMLFGIGLFLVGSVLCGVAWSL